jgi:hypothetical protein
MDELERLMREAHERARFRPAEETSDEEYIRRAMSVLRFPYRQGGIGDLTEADRCKVLGLVEDWKSQRVHEVHLLGDDDFLL